MIGHVCEHEPPATSDPPNCVQSGMTTWHHDDNPDGKIVELHGNTRYLLCSNCHHISEAKACDLIHLRRNRPRVCSECHHGHLRFKIMLYDDEEADLITPEDVWTRFEEDLAVADLVVWVGISFEQARLPPPPDNLASSLALLRRRPRTAVTLSQATSAVQSASTEYFRKARSFLMDHNRLEAVPQFVVNPDDTAFTNLTSTCTNTQALNLHPVLVNADEAMDGLAAAVARDEPRLAAVRSAVAAPAVAVAAPAAAAAAEPSEEEDDAKMLVDTPAAAGAPLSRAFSRASPALSCSVVTPRVMCRAASSG